MTACGPRVFGLHCVGRMLGVNHLRRFVEKLDGAEALRHEAEAFEALFQDFIETAPANSVEQSARLDPKLMERLSVHLRRISPEKEREFISGYAPFKRAQNTKLLGHAQRLNRWLTDATTQRDNSPAHVQTPLRNWLQKRIRADCFAEYSLLPASIC